MLTTLVVLWVVYAGLLGTSHDQLDGKISYPALVLGPAAALAAICACYLCIPRPRHWAYGAQVLLALLVAVWFVVKEAYIRPAPPPPDAASEGR